MEVKEIIESLRYCASNKGCPDCPIGGAKYSYVDCCVMSVAAERLEELEAELGKRTIHDRPYEEVWK